MHLWAMAEALWCNCSSALLMQSCGEALQGVIHGSRYRPQWPVDRCAADRRRRDVGHEREGHYRTGVRRSETVARARTRLYHHQRPAAARNAHACLAAWTDVADGSLQRWRDCTA